MQGEEIIDLLVEIRDLLSSIKDELSDIRGNGLYGVDDLANKLDDIEIAIKNI